MRNPWKYLLFFITILMAIQIQSCHKEQKKSAEFPGETNLSDTSILSDTSLFYDITIDGQREFQVSLQNGYGIYWDGGAGCPPPLNKPVKFSSGIAGHVKDFRFTKGPLFYTVADTAFPICKQKKFNFFPPGNYAFTDAVTADGVSLRWVDANGTEWSTSYGIADQTGSNFTITESIPGPDPSFYEGIALRAVFNCRLYDKNGHSNQLINGRFRLSMWL